MSKPARPAGYCHFTNIVRNHSFHFVKARSWVPFSPHDHGLHNMCILAKNCHYFVVVVAVLVVVVVVVVVVVES